MSCGRPCSLGEVERCVPTVLSSIWLKSIENKNLPHDKYFSLILPKCSSVSLNIMVQASITMFCIKPLENDAHLEIVQISPY